MRIVIQDAGYRVITQGEWAIVQERTATIKGVAWREAIRAPLDKLNNAYEEYQDWVNAEEE